MRPEHVPESQDLGFSFRTRKNGEVEVLHHGHLAATLRGEEASSFLTEVSDSSSPDAQQLMARLTGNYKRGNERLVAEPLAPNAMPFKTHEEYFAHCSAEARALLEQVQREVERQVPGATRCIGYSMPAFRQQRIFFYFAAFKKHIGIYPPVTEDEALISETAPFRGPKGNLSFPYSQQLPLDLIGRVAKALAVQYAAQFPKSAKASAQFKQ